MGILSHAITQAGKLVEATIDKYGDQVASDETSVSCRFRYITQIDRTTNIEGVGTGNDAIIWFEPDVDVQEGSIINAEGAYWRVERLIRARRLSDSTVLFLKAFVNKYEVAEDFS